MRKWDQCQKFKVCLASSLKSDGVTWAPSHLLA